MLSSRDKGTGDFFKLSMHGVLFLIFLTCACNICFGLLLYLVRGVLPICQHIQSDHYGSVTIVQ